MSSTSSVTEVEVCKCGRVYTHCLACGQRKPYVKKKRSAELSFELGKRVWVYSCTNCPVETHSGMECQAPPVETGAGFKYVPFQKPVELPIWGNLTPGTPAYFEALNAFAVELTEKKGITLVKAYVEAVKKGWSLEGAEIGEEVQEALNLAGLGAGPEVAPQVGGGRSAVTSQVGSQAPNLIQEPIGLDEIIKGMQKEQK